jgi:hypothetical protein
MFLNFRKFINRRISFNVKRFKSAIDVEKIDSKSGSFDKSISLVFVATSKDFDLLFHSLSFSLKAISDYRYLETMIIVPDLQVEQCQMLIPDDGYPNIRVFPESYFVRTELILKLRDSFGDRGNWVLQQLLKVQAVMYSRSDACLIVDSDTILTRKRSWFNSSGQQILCPTVEFHPPYYSFLNRLNICEIEPQNSFISHHMIMQKEYLSSALDLAGFSDLDNFVDYIIENSDKNTQSPICIEYELYAQFMVGHLQHMYWRGLWANVSLRKDYMHLVLKNRLIFAVLRLMFNSISFHSWSKA